MGPWGRRALRERFDDAEPLGRQPPPDTHRCDLYLATDASVRGDVAGFGAIVERPDGVPIARWRRPGRATDNNDAEVRALHFGLDRLAARVPSPERLGVLVDHRPLADAVAACADPALSTPVRPPSRTASAHHWGGITARMAAIPQVRVAVVPGRSNPAHPLANGIAAD